MQLSDDLIADLNAALDATRAPEVPGAAVAILSPDGDWFGASGVSDLANNTPLQPDDRFEAGSLTKTFIATAILQLVEADQLSLEDRLTDWLPAAVTDRVPNAGEITVQQILQHTSGIADYLDGLAAQATTNPALFLQDWQPPQLLGLIDGVEPFFEPGESWQYSNTNYLLAGLIIEAVTGNSYASELRTRILDPLNLQDTFIAGEESIPGGYIKGYWDFDGNGGLDDLSITNLSWAESAGSLISNTQDLATFFDALLKDRTLLQPETLAQMLDTIPVDSPNYDSYGLGIGTLESPNRFWYAHRGQTLGFRSNLWYSPAEDITYVELTNGRSDDNLVRDLLPTFRNGLENNTGENPTMPQVSLSTSTTFDGDLNALVEDQGTALTVRFDLDEPAPEGGLRVYVDSEIEQIINRLDLPGFAFNPTLENIDAASLVTNFDNSGFALTIEAGATFGTFTIDVFDNPEPDSFLPETFDGRVEAALSLRTQDEVDAADQGDISGVSEYTVDPSGASSTVIFADEASQLVDTPEPPTPEPPTEPPIEPPTEPPTGELPVVSFEAIPATVSEEAANAQIVWQWNVTGDFPAEGITINFDTLGDNDVIKFTEQFAADREPEFVNSDIVGFDEETGRLQILLTSPNASFVLPILNDVLEEGTQPFDFQLAAGDGYTVDPIKNATLVTITDDNGGPGVGPTVGISATPTDLAEGDPLVVTFTVEGEIPAEGVEVLVQSPVAGALGQFDLADLGNITTTGIAGLPRVADGGGGSFFVTLTEPTATISLEVFDDIVAEEPLELPFTLANGEEYEVDASASGIVLSISDEPQPVGPTVGLTVNKTDVTEGESITLTFAVEGEIPEGGLPVLVNDTNSAQNQIRSLTEFDVANIELTGIDGFPTPADGDSGFFVTLTEPTATITLPVFDEGVNEDEATESFTFEVIDGEAYEVNAAASSITLNISDAADGGQPPTEPPTGSPIVSVDLIGGTFGDDGELALPYLVEDEAAGSSILSLIVQSSEPVPEEGLVVNINTDLTDITEFIQGSNFVPTAFGGEVLGAIYNDAGAATGLKVRLDNRNTVVNFTNGVGLAETGPQDVSFVVEPGEGYTPAADATSITVYDSADQLPTPASVPEIGISVSQTEPLIEGQGDITLDFTVTGEIPPEGVLAYVDTGEFAGLVDFDLLNAATVGAPFPAPDGQAGGFYIKLTEPTASVTLTAREDEETEGLELIELSLQPLAGYTIAEGGQDVSIALSDDATTQIQVSLEVEPTILIESEETVSVHTFSLSSAPPAEGITITVSVEGLGEFDPSGLVTTGIIGEVSIAESLPEQLIFTITEQTATISLPTANDGVAEDLETATFTLLEGEGYQINPEAKEGVFTLADTPADVPAPALEESEQNDTIATATATGLTADSATVTINGEISGNFFDSDLSLRTDETEDVDMYSVELAAGDVLRIDTDAQQVGSEADTLVRLFDAEGNALAQNDDAAAPDELFNEGIGFDSYLEYTADTAGTYYVGISTFSNGELDFITDPYDPNVVASGSGASSGEYTLNLSVNQEESIDPTDIPDGDGTGPVVSFTAIPSTFNGDAVISNALIQSTASEDESLDLTSTITLQFSAEGEIPEEGVEIFLNSNLDLSDRLSPSFGRGVEVLGAIYDENSNPTGLRINLTATTALLTLTLESPEVAPTDGTETLALSLVPSAGYQATETLASLPIYDTLADVPTSGTPPAVSITASETALVESVGNTTTLTFNLSEAPPADGVLIYVDSETEGVISEFNVFDAEITGADAPFPNGDVSGFYLRMTEQTATITVSAFDETTNPQLTPEQALEGIESVTFSIENGEGYTVSPDSGTVDLTIADNPDSVVIPDTDDGDGDEESPENPENELNDTLETAIDTGLSASNPTFSTEATLEVTDITLNPDVPEDEQLFYANLVDATEDVDMYAFTLEAGQTITIDVDGGGTGAAGVEGSTLDSILRIFDADGNEVAISENDAAPDEVFQANGDTYIEFAAPEAGTYYAGVSVLGNTFYDPNVQGSGSGWIFEGFEPGAYRLNATLGDGGDGGGNGGELVGDDADNILDGQAGADTIAGGLGNDVIAGGDGDDILRGDLNTRNPQDNVIGGNDIIFGGEGNDRIGGKSGNDILSGDAGDDFIWGDAGDDIIMGVTGNDILVGDNFSQGSGSDLFVFGNGDGTDTILDFEVGTDRIGLVEGKMVFEDLTITHEGSNTLLGVTSSGETLAILQGVQASSLSESSFEIVPDMTNPEEALAMLR